MKWLLLLLLMGVRPAWSQEEVKTPLPDSLTRGAGMVKRMDLTEIAIESPRKARLHRKYIYTILNHSGDAYSSISTWYDKFHDLDNVSAVLYDAQGHVVKKLKKNDLEDWNVEGAGMLMVDSRVKFYQFGYHIYPYTISFEQDVTLNGLFALPPQWLPQSERNVSVVSCNLVIHAPADYPLQYRDYHLPDSVRISNNKSTVTYSWQLSNRPIQIPEQYAPAWFEREPRVSLAPGIFEIEGFTGTCDSWSGLAHFVAGLHQGKGLLPPEAKRQVHALTEGLSDEKEKIAVLYRFLQQNTHYVGIELGIGGWQPYDAAYVWSKKYGDCKALANYMVALLKEAGIRANPVLIRAGYEVPDLDSGFACNQFNHEIAVAFPGKDTVWLECTSSAVPPGYLGGFTADRDGLLLDENGGHLIHTPVYGLRDNKITRVIKAGIDDHGNLEATLQTEFSGLEQDWAQFTLGRLNKKDLLEQRRQAAGLGNFTISDLKDTLIAGPVPVVIESMQAAGEQFATMVGNRMMITPGIFLKHGSRIQEETNRKTGFELRPSLEEQDSLIIQLPPGWTPEGNLPLGNLTSAFGGYHVHSTYQDGLLTIVCSYRQYKGIYPASDYERLVRIFNFVYREANRELVFVKAPSKTGP